MRSMIFLVVLALAAGAVGQGNWDAFAKSNDSTPQTNQNQVSPSGTPIWQSRDGHDEAARAYFESKRSGSASSASVRYKTRWRTREIVPKNAARKSDVEALGKRIGTLEKKVDTLDSKVGDLPTKQELFDQLRPAQKSAQDSAATTAEGEKTSPMDNSWLVLGGVLVAALVIWLCYYIFTHNRVQQPVAAPVNPVGANGMTPHQIGGVRQAYEAPSPPRDSDVWGGMFGPVEGGGWAFQRYDSRPPVQPPAGVNYIPAADPLVFEQRPSQVRQAPAAPAVPAAPAAPAAPQAAPGGGRRRGGAQAQGAQAGGQQPGQAPNP